ncbi:unnamed protein product [Rotaria socialis]|uniref:Insulin-like domain-containing protein n=1 Tax=Rotaria socialis TaxID=392032 RepID=A0A819YNV6_9BILA|nr:unnamed protein product [Rotaria socialis]CAF3183003.1 unnamed protein product [Rotaria socialis]CAF4151784.1 unnamed protein product [Rotaria socialis]CAF4294399.1 unnamed protein product [Rotaria socialis]
MFRSSIFKFAIILIFMTSLINAKNTNNRRLKVLAIRQPTSIKMCGLALIHLLDTVCTRAEQILVRNRITTTLSSPTKRPRKTQDNLYSYATSIIDNTQFNDTLIYDCCLQVCTLKKLLKYC